MSILVFLLTTSTALADPFVINEVVSNPRQDWNDGTPFDATPGAGVPNTDTDEYVELKNVSVTPQSLEGYYLEMTDSDSVFDCFTFDAAVVPPAPCTQSQVYRVHDANGALVTAGTLQDRLRAVPPGGYVVLGNPSGSMLTQVTTTLVDGVPVDSLSINFSTSWPGDESASRFPDGVDTDVAGDDLAPRPGTPGSSNGGACALQAGDLVVNEVISAAQQDWDADGGGVPFDGNAGTGTVGNGDELVELANTSGAALDLTGCVLDLVDTTREKFVFSAIDAPTRPYVRVFDDTGTLLGTAGTITNVPAGGYVLVGDPPGTMNLSGVVVAVHGATGTIDAAALDLSASSTIDESRSRFPDATDSDVESVDFSPIAASPGRSNGTLCMLNLGDAVVNEVVTDPQRDWNNDSAGIPFDGTAGAGTVNASDELVELKNTSAGDADFVGCVLVMDDSTPEKMVLQDMDAPGSPYVRVFDELGVMVGTATMLSAVPAGGYVLIGDPAGTLNNAITITLQHDLGDLDMVTVNANADGLLDEAACRFPDGQDSDVDGDDISRLRATPGVSNGSPCPLAAGDAVVNEVISDPQQDWDHGDPTTAFDGTPGLGVVDSNDELIELSNLSGAAASFVGCVLDMTDSSSDRLVLQPLDAPADPYVRVFDDQGVMVGGASALDAVPAGGFVLIGNPPGTLNNDVIVTLTAAVELDSQSFGDDAPSLNASSLEDESGSRVPNGIDTDVGSVDFKLQRATPGANNELDECALAIANCDPLATCADTAAGFDCICPAGYVGTGVSCIDANECQAGSDDCDAHALCANTVGSFTCTCIDGYTGNGKTCTDVDECAGGEANCGDDATCTNTAGSFVCVCNAGFDGDGQTCDDVNECLADTDDCHPDASCTNTIGSFDCTCKSGFVGDGRSCTATSGGSPDDKDAPSSSDSCACTAVGVQPQGSAWLWFAAAAGLALARRPRRRLQ